MSIQETRDGGSHNDTPVWLGSALSPGASENVRYAGVASIRERVSRWCGGLRRRWWGGLEPAAGGRGSGSLRRHGRLLSDQL